MNQKKQPITRPQPAMLAFPLSTCREGESGSAGRGVS